MDAVTESPKRTAIVAAARELFVTQGYGAVSMDAVARAAAVSKATLYAHFESKDALFASIIGQACRDNIVFDGRLPECGTDVATDLTLIGRRILRFFLEPRTLAIYRVVIAESGRFPELGRAFYEAGPAVLTGVFAEWLAAHVAAGRLALPDPEAAAGQFLGLLRTGLYMRATLGLTPAPDDAAVDATVASAVDLFVRAYGRG